jgi:hypothetical protein
VRRIFGPVNKNDKWKYRTNTELKDRPKKKNQTLFRKLKEKGWDGLET